MREAVALLRRRRRKSLIHNTPIRLILPRATLQRNRRVRRNMGLYLQHTPTLILTSGRSRPRRDAVVSRHKLCAHLLNPTRPQSLPRAGAVSRSEGVGERGTTRTRLILKTSSLGMDVHRNEGEVGVGRASTKTMGLTRMMFLCGVLVALHLDDASRLPEIIAAVVRAVVGTIVEVVEVVVGHIAVADKEVGTRRTLPAMLVRVLPALLKAPGTRARVGVEG